MKVQRNFSSGISKTKKFILVLTIFLLGGEGGQGSS